MPSIDTILDRGFSNGQPWDRTPRHKAAMFLAWPFAALVVLLMLVVLPEDQQASAVAYVVSSHESCALVLSDVPGGVPVAVVEELEGDGCGELREDARVYYDREADVQVAGRRTTAGVEPLARAAVVGFALLLLVPPVLAAIATRRKRAARRTAHPAATHALEHDVPPAGSIPGRASGMPRASVGVVATRLMLGWLAVMVVAGGLVAVWAYDGTDDERAVGYVVSGPANCMLELADSPDGAPEHTVEQSRAPRQTVCETPQVGERFYYDPRTLEEVSPPQDDWLGIAAGVGVALFGAGTALAVWIPLRRRRRAAQEGSAGPGAPTAG